jgi:glycosyltransferase involved in cell wall biosynthesis
MNDVDQLPISVVIPAYNRAHLLPRALASVEVQRPRRPAEVIVVDDCSTDGTADVAERLGVRVVGHSENRGAASARNSGFRAASQPWVALLDSDDEWLPHHLDTLWRARDGHVLVSGAALACGQDAADVRYHGTPEPRPVSLQSPAAIVYPENFIAASGALVRTAAVRTAGGYKTSLRYAEDFDLWIRILEQGTGLALPDVVYRWHRHPGQKSRGSDQPRRVQRQIVMSYGDRPWWSERLAERRFAVAEWDDMRLALAERELRRAAGHAWWIVRRPQRVRGVWGLLVWRFRVRRRSRAVAQLARRPSDGGACEDGTGQVADEPLPVSVVIPAYNREGFLADALKSVAAQRPRRPADVIVVDDCSSDRTAEVAERLGARVVRHEKNRGAGAARNTGLRAAQQPWIALLDSDDRWLPYHLARLWPLRGEHLMLAAGALRVGDDPALDRYQGAVGRRPRVLDSPSKVLFPENPIPASGVLVRREAARAAGGWSESVPYAEDLDLWIRILERGTALLVPSVGYLWRVHRDQKSRDSRGARRAYAGIVRSYAGRPWFSQRLAERHAAVTAWDDLRSDLAEGRRASAAARVIGLAGRPWRVLGLIPLLVYRWRVRRRSWLTARNGAPSTAILPGDRDFVRRARVGAGESVRIDATQTGLGAVRTVARLVRRPTASALVSSRRQVLLVRLTGVRPERLPTSASARP